MIKPALVITLFCGALASGCTISDDAASTTSTGADGSTTDAATTATTTADDSTTDMSEPTTSPDEEILNCDPWAQDCPDGFKCMAYTDEGDYFTATKCTPADPDGGIAGDECYADGGWSTGVDDCAAGHACWNINPETSIGGCVALCTGTMDAYACPEPEDVCVFWVPGLAHVCLQTCDPFLQDCPQGQGCGPNWASGAQEFVCYLDWSFDEGQEFDQCQSTNTCDPGLLCADATHAVECDQDNYCCISYCDLDAPACTGEGSVCEPFYEPNTAPPEYANLGYCSLPG